ncbi:hypothetical protein JCGZ_21639 [Jatropha curcas]|uniref:Uncharacterized protein n=1 Tax=Jatropha curcas TaxID=180498 RepID=A0A067JEH3_JATCU|nr:GDSL esterase/lipase At1g29670 [Jatropha curcas]KDP21168.1 hypothetical protein JCGZ_21639 [Jatropha curcas]
MALQKQLFLFASALLLVSNLQNYGVAQEVPCYFIFGDSFAVNGNDKNLNTLKADYLPYGVDFPGGPSGRFSDGRTMVDIIAHNIGFKEDIPSFLTVANNSEEILKGANYASGAAILQAEISGTKVTVVSLTKQEEEHQKTVKLITEKLGDKNKAEEHLKSCLYTVGVGSNDYLIDYYVAGNNGSEPKGKKPSEAFAENLVDGYLFDHLNALYKASARKVAVFGLGPLGCCPSEVAKYPINQKCISVIDTDMTIFNSRIPTIIERLNKEFQDAQFTYIDMFKLTESAFAGFKVVDKPCCEVNDKGMCVPNKKNCENPKDHFFWDGYRPTENANLVLANLAYNASVPAQAKPFNIEQLVSKTAKKNEAPAAKAPAAETPSAETPK